MVTGRSSTLPFVSRVWDKKLRRCSRTFSAQLSDTWTPDIPVTVLRSHFNHEENQKKLWKPTIGYSDADSAKLLSDEFSVHTMVIINVIYFAEKRNTNRTMKLSKHLAGQQRHMACNSCRHCKIKASIWRKLGDGNHVWRLSVSASRITSLKV